MVFNWFGILFKLIMNTVPALHDHSGELDLLHGKEPSLTEDGGFNEESLLIAPMEMWLAVAPDSSLISSPVCSPQYFTWNSLKM